MRRGWDAAAAFQLNHEHATRLNDLKSWLETVRMVIRSIGVLDGTEENCGAFRDLIAQHRSVSALLVRPSQRG
jgi:hypothetical protein